MLLAIDPFTGYLIPFASCPGFVEVMLEFAGLFY